MNAVSIDPILNLQDVIYRSGLSRATIYRKIACGTFPKPVCCGGRRKGWRKADFEQWFRNPEGYVA